MKTYLLATLSLLLAGLAFIGGEGAVAMLMLITGLGCLAVAPFMSRFEDRDIWGELRRGQPVYVTEDPGEDTLESLKAKPMYLTGDKRNGPTDLFP